MFQTLREVKFASNSTNVSTRGFWTKQHQMVFFDVGVFEPNTKRYESKSLKQCYVMNDKGKRRNYTERVCQVEMAFLPH